MHHRLYDMCDLKERLTLHEAYESYMETVWTSDGTSFRQMPGKLLQQCDRQGGMQYTRGPGSDRNDQAIPKVRVFCKKPEKAVRKSGILFRHGGTACLFHP